MRKKRYTLYEVEGTPRRRWKTALLWSTVALIVVVLAVLGGSYLWFRAEVSSANDRVTPEIRAALEEKPSTTLTTTPPAAPPSSVPGDSAAGESAASSAGPPANPTATTVAVPVKEPSPSAMNLLIIGSDRRPDSRSLGGRSDTLMVVHIDPDQDYLSVLSLPRDLRVSIPGHGKGKLNTAYAFGGPVLAIKTIEETTGVDINHYLEIGFAAFSQMVDSLGGVYVDVDKRYYNPKYYFEPIDLYPGYQLLNGADSLDYVRFRHDRNMDFGRMERQQRFMTAVREQAMGWDLPFKLPGLISALFRNVTTDLDANEILRLARWGIGLSGDNIRGITVTGSTPVINGGAYVVVSEDRLARAVNRLLNKSEPEEAPGQTPTTESSPTTTTEGVDLSGLTLDVLGASGRSGEAAAAAEWLRSLGVTVGGTVEGGTTEKRSAVEYPSGMLSEARRVAQVTGVDRVRRARVERLTLLLGDDFRLPQKFALPATPDSIPDAQLWKETAASAPFAVQAPTYIPDDYRWTRKIPDQGPAYGIEVGGGTRPAIRMLYALKSNGDQVLGITETSWLDAPAASKGLEITHDGTVYTVVRNDQKVERVWWKADGTLYWVSNTLSHLLSQEQMVTIAESMIPIPR